MKSSSKLVTVICLALFLVSPDASGQFKEDTTVKESMRVLNEIMAIPATGIPQSLLRDAQAVAIIPSVIKGSFVVGARYGNGVVLVRDDSGIWQAPMFVSLTGGNIGWQVGVQATDVVLVFKTRRSVEGLLSGRFTLGADAAVAAGPVGRQATAATDSGLGAQIYSYSRSRGLFAGVSFDGSVIRVDPMSNANYYRAPSPGTQVVVPPNAVLLAQQVMQYAGNQSPLASATPGASPLAQQHSTQEVDHVRDQLARLALHKCTPDWTRHGISTWHCPPKCSREMAIHRWQR